LHESIAIISKDTPLNHIAAPYFVEHIRKLVQAKYAGRDLYDRGLKIYTTLEMRQQRAAEAAVRQGLDAVDHRFSFRGPVAHLDDAALEKFVEGMPQPYVGPKQDAASAAGVIVAGKPYLAAFERQGKKAYARVGAFRVVMDEYDAARVVRWTERRGNKLEAGDLIPVRVTKVERKVGSGHGTKTAAVEIVEQAQLAQKPEVQAALVAV